MLSIEIRTNKLGVVTMRSNVVGSTATQIDESTRNAYRHLRRLGYSNFGALRLALKRAGIGDAIADALASIVRC